jgi:glyoxylate reductase
MGKKRVFVTRILPGNVLEEIDEQVRFVNSPTGATLPNEVLLEKMRGVEGIISTLSDRVDGPLMDRAGDSLEVISNYAVGFNNVDVDEATRRGVVVCNTPGVLTDATADMAFAMILSIARGIHRAHEFTENGLFKGWEPDLFLGVPVFGGTLGIVGLGNIGKALARRAKGFEMNILYHNRKRVSPGIEKELGAAYTSLDELLGESDFVVLLVPLNEGTRGMIGEREIGLMKKDACLINISRGEVVKERALAKALAGKMIRGAALDVYEREPQIDPLLITLPNVLLLPHIGSATEKARMEMARLCVDNLMDVLRGDEPQASVNYSLVR